MLKRELELEEKVNLLEKEIKVLGEVAENMRLDLEEAVDCLRLENEALKMVLRDVVPEFQGKYRSAKNKVIQEVDPQWIAKSEAER